MTALARIAARRRTVGPCLTLRGWTAVALLALVLALIAFSRL